MKQFEVNRRPETQGSHADAEMDQIVAEEEKVLARVHRTIDTRRPTSRGQLIDYDAELIALRDQIREARLEDIPPLIEEMERLQQVANRRAKVIDAEGATPPVVLENSEIFAARREAPRVRSSRWGWTVAAFFATTRSC